MKLSIYSLKKVLYAGEAESVNCKISSGEITVLDHHRPLLGILKEGIISIIDTQKKEHYFKAKSGFLEVKETNEARMLVEE